MRYRFLLGIAWLFFVTGCGITEQEASPTGSEQSGGLTGGDKTFSFPPYMTPLESYSEVSIGEFPVVKLDGYKLKVHGLVDSPRTYTFNELLNLPMVERIQTIECIGNQVNGDLIGTVLWRGFDVLELLRSSGIGKNARTVNFICADGYTSSNYISELKSLRVIGALYANKELLPVKMGSPLRILNEGYYGIKNPGWVTEIEVTSEDKKDYWLRSSWKIETPMEVDSKIFFPDELTGWSVGDTVIVGGAAYGSDSIVSVEYSVDNGVNWKFADIIRRSDEDPLAWVFWKASFRVVDNREYVLRSRATDYSGQRQPLVDSFGLDGTNSSPSVRLKIK